METATTNTTIDQDVNDILNIILKGGRTEAEAVFIAHVVVRNVDRFFDELSSTHDTQVN